MPTRRRGYIGQKVTCSRCHYVGEIEKGDEITPGNQTDPSDLVTCPNCGATIELASGDYNGPG